ncbi:hypothetical protein OFC56_33435, partial [Escherichia coli]|nr:hypothetical protein [Escherichia coli]
VVFFIVYGVWFVNPDNWRPFLPPREPAPAGEGFSFSQTTLWELLFGSAGSYGFTGMITGASIVFFAYIGFDIVATTAEETRNPQRDLPI